MRRSLACFLAVVLGLSAGAAMAGEEVTFEATDGYRLSGTLHLPEQGGRRPAVILLHQGGSDRSEWDSFVPRFLADGYVVMAYDIRGHGASGELPNREALYALFNDPAQAPAGLEGAVAFLRSQERVDGERLAVVGASIGANLAAVASSRGWVKTAVAVSGKTSAATNLAGDAELAMRSAFFIASQVEEEGKRAIWARELYRMTADPKKMHITSGRAHGSHIFKDQPKSFDLVLEWLRERL